MSIESLSNDEVLALQFDESAVATELAHWCGGEVREDALWVPTSKGPMLVNVDDWVVRAADGTFSVVSAVDFAFRFASA